MEKSPLWMVSVIDDLIRVACSYEAYEVANLLALTRKNLIKLKPGEMGAIGTMADVVTLRLALETCWQLGEGYVGVQEYVEKALEHTPALETESGAQLVPV
ncbi:hypothetical protein [Aliiroseovarius lamellibrachiae]|uniref:hypothetical protein n=1 Tax=Aliiroseovarius lamellibrachiae TaxID=1924933 RepID=UPI001BE01B0E|nr:hypothetical protein [Aliiroseovarius lamellibrachiae]MBT2132692.1 hypothetical protein [Aliiroseovarius lamellibrachiae]